MQYPGRKFFGVFPILSAWFLPEIKGSWQESTGKIQKISGWNTDFMFQQLSFFFAAGFGG